MEDDIKNNENQNSMNENLFRSLNINDELLKMLSRNNFINMTPVQSKCIPEFLKHDVIVQSQTGSGKTLAYLIPIINKLMLSSNSDNIIYAVIIVPTRELCIQIHEVICQFGVKSEILIGGIPIVEDTPKINTSIIIGTPGRLFEIIMAHKNAFNKIKYLVIDECDKLLGFEFENKLLKIIKILPKNRITGLFSATIDETVRKLSLHTLKNPISIKTGEDMPKKLSINYKVLNPLNKIQEVFNTVKSQKCIIFMATCNSVEFFYSLFKSYCNANDETLKLIFWHKMHGKMDQKDRSKTYDAFEKEGGVLICTDVAARGIDFKDIDTVIHFDIPKDYTNIVHRSGRTARNGKSGKSIIFMMPNEKAFVNFMKLKNIDLILDEHEEENPHFKDIYNIIKLTMQDDLLNKAVKAFVSYIQSYKEHILNYILNYKELDFDGIAELYFLKKIPSMIELKNVKFKNFKKTESESKIKRRKIVKKTNKD